MCPNWRIRLSLVQNSCVLKLTLSREIAAVKPLTRSGTYSAFKPGTGIANLSGNTCNEAHTVVKKKEKVISTVVLKCSVYTPFLTVYSAKDAPFMYKTDWPTWVRLQCGPMETTSPRPCKRKGEAWLHRRTSLTHKVNNWERQRNKPQIHSQTVFSQLGRIFLLCSLCQRH